MWAFMLGVIVGVIGKAVYDLFREEQLPAGAGLNTGRIEALIDETRQTVRDLREEVRQVVGAGASSVQEKAGRLLGGTPEAEKVGEPAAPAGERLRVTSGEGGGAAPGREPSPGGASRSGPAPSESAGESTGGAPAGGEEGSGDVSGVPTSTHGTRETMS